MNTESRWMTERALPAYPPMAQDLTVDVAIVGGGVTGITTAYLLNQAGLKVVVLERNVLASGETGHTTAHLTYVTDARLTHLIRTYGRDHAGAVWDAGLAALDCLHAAILEEQIACDFARVPGFLHLPVGSPVERRALEQMKVEAAHAAEMGFEARYVAEAPVVGRPAIQFADQAQFHPMKYMAGLAGAITRTGGRIFEHSEAVEFSKGPFRIRSNGHWVTCRHIVIATHVPLLGENNLLSGALLQSRLAGYSSYVVGATIPAGTAAPACYWDTNDPYDYLRIDRRADADYVIYGGEDHKTGQESDTVARFARVEERMRALFPQAQVQARWSGQVIQTNDSLPLIGEVLPGQFIATGYIGNGIIFGTLAAIMARDWILGRKNPWAELFDPHRTKILGGTWDYVKENADYPYYLLKDRVRSAARNSPASLAVGEGQILLVNGHKAACHRDEMGNLHAVSPSCTHLGCLVHWNNAEQTWDCPCHGSRFKPTGEVIAGPAETPLPAIEVQVPNEAEH